MKAATLALLMSALSLAGVGLVFIRLDRLDERLRPLTERRSEARGRERGAASEDAAGDHRRGGWEYEPARGPESALGGAAAAPDGRGRSDPSLRELQEQVTQLQKEQERLRRRPRPVPFRFSSRRSVGSLKQLSSILKLSTTQKAQVGSSIENAKRRVEDLLKIPDESGRSPYERRQELRRKMEEARETGNWQEIAPLAMQAHNYRKTKIPGGNATYGEEIGRIKREARAEIARGLDAGQKKAFEETRIDPLLGTGAGGVQLAFTTSIGESPVGIVVEGGAVALEDSTGGEQQPAGEKEEE